MHFTEEMTATPGQFIAALTDFGEGRERIWGYSANSYLKVLGQDSTEADLTEGSGGVWETLHYDWSDPSPVDAGRPRSRQPGCRFTGGRTPPGR
jgi:hypothetical protein